MTHPTPADIRSEVMSALHADFEKTGYQANYIPVRVYRIVEEAISRACDKANEPCRD